MVCRDAFQSVRLSETILSATGLLAPGVEYGWVAPLTDDADPVKAVGAVVPVQTHSLNVGVLTEPRQSFPDTDALITRFRGVAIGVRTADCIPVLLYAPDIEAVAAVHAGWRGTVGDIVGATVSRLEAMGADTGRMLAHVGIGIGCDCFEVGSELAECFKKAGLGGFVLPGPFTDRLTGEPMDPGRSHIDLRGANVSHLLRRGIPEANITVAPECTRCSVIAPGPGASVRLPSWRRDHGTTRRMLTWIRLREESRVKGKRLMGWGLCPF